MGEREGSMHDEIGQLHELAALIRYASDRVGLIKTDNDGEIELRKIGIVLLNLGHQVEGIRANAHARRVARTVDSFQHDESV